jgi:hypothetical protein
MPIRRRICPSRKDATMARILLGLTLAGSVLLVGFWGHPASGIDPDQRQRNLLGVHVALEQGQAMIQRGDFAGAVVVLEKHIAHIDGSRVYLAALRDAYRGHVAALDRAGKQAEARRVRGFLEILEPVPAARTPEVQTRAKVEQDTSDPFAEGNRAVSRENPGTLLANAEKEFRAEHYEQAATLYARAEKAQPGAAKECHERWGYCRLFGVAQKVNKGESGAQLEAEVRAAMQLSSRLGGFGQKLLEKVGQPAKTVAVAVKHSKLGSWSVAETDSFRVFHKGGEQSAEKVAQIVEATRVGMARKWFNEEATAWGPRCDIYLHATGEDYAKETGAPVAAPGHSTIDLAGGRVARRRVDIRMDASFALDGTLPHETTHVVLAGRFDGHHVPRWADEGMAVLSEPRERVELHLKNLPSHRRDETLFSVAALMKQNDYPEGRRVGAFYAQSVSVVDFLVKKKDAVTFSRFVRMGLKSGYESALVQYYGYRSFAEMEKDWTAHAFGGEGVASSSGKSAR